MGKIFCRATLRRGQRARRSLAGRPRIVPTNGKNYRPKGRLSRPLASAPERPIGLRHSPAHAVTWPTRWAPGGRVSTARAAAKAARDAAIIRLKDESKSNREVGGKVGVDERTVRNVGAQKGKASENAQPPFLTEAAKADLRELAGQAHWRRCGWSVAGVGGYQAAAEDLRLARLGKGRASRLPPLPT